VGGYASGPVLKQALRMGIPVLIQEQNSYAGVTNRLLAPKASAICVAYDGMEKYFPSGKIIKTGNPVRQNFDNLNVVREEALRFFKVGNDLPVVLVIGGSLGAGSINKCLSDNIQELSGHDCRWIWQTGKYYYDEIVKIIPDTLRPNISVHPFIDRMDLAFAAADIIISRAGAGTISELCLVGKPVILVPSPNVAEDHQTKNARALVARNAAIMISDDSLMNSLIAEVKSLVNDSDRKKALSENISKMAERDADVRIAEEVLKLIQK
jgi:UDP-N-acetylglucosamine--N-acetylmuramyl-(pentapeptide) pyrophosphoryl-undecaprenol N-acetylglucosamine transferase